MNKQPQLMDLSRMRDILEPHLSQISESIFFNGELGIVRGDHTVFRLLMRQKPPFTINDHRFGLILNGEAHINFNLQERHVTAGTLVYTSSFRQTRPTSAQPATFSTPSGM